MSEVTWIWKKFDELTPDEVYRSIQLRERVFAVEQNCVYLDCDGVDPKCWHLLGLRNGELAAYLRVVPAGIKYAEASIGRVVTSPAARGTGLGKVLVTEALRRMEALLGRVPIRISAQAYLEKFYAGYGFERVGDNDLEDGIPHCEMLRS